MTQEKIKPPFPLEKLPAVLKREEVVSVLTAHGGLGTFLVHEIVKPIGKRIFVGVGQLNRYQELADEDTIKEVISQLEAVGIIAIVQPDTAYAFIKLTRAGEELFKYLHLVVKQPQFLALNGRKPEPLPAEINTFSA